MDNDHDPIDTSQLLDNLTGRFDKEELKTLAFQVGVDWDELAGTAKTPKPAAGGPGAAGVVGMAEPNAATAHL